MNAPTTSAHSPVHTDSKVRAKDSEESTSVPTSTPRLTHDPHHDGPDTIPRPAPEQADQPADLTTLGAEIQDHYQQLRRFARITLEHAISLGGLLHRAKKQAGHGGWQAFLGKVGMESRTAQHYMHLFNHREELQGKNENVSCLTIGGALQALRRGRQQSHLTPAPATVKIEGEETRGAVQTDPTAIGNLTGGLTPSTGPSAPEDMGGIPSVHGQRETALEDVDQANPGDDRNREGYRLADGRELVVHPHDGGPVPFDRTQALIDAVVSQNHSCREEYRRADEQVLFEQQFLISLVRAANQIFSGQKTVSSAEAEAFCNALNTLRNTVATLPGVRIPGSERGQLAIQNYYRSARAWHAPM